MIHPADSVNSSFVDSRLECANSRVHALLVAGFSPFGNRSKNHGQQDGQPDNHAHVLLFLVTDLEHR